MRIGLFFSGLAGGGTHRRMLLLALGLIERGHAVTVIVASAEGAFRAALPLEARLVELGGDGRRLPVIGRHRGLWVQLGCPALMGWPRTADLDVLVATSTPANVVAALARAQAAPALPLILVLNLPPSAVARPGRPLRTATPRPLASGLCRCRRARRHLRRAWPGMPQPCSISVRH